MSRGGWFGPGAAQGRGGDRTQLPPLPAGIAPLIWLRLAPDAPGYGNPAMQQFLGQLGRAGFRIAVSGPGLTPDGATPRHIVQLPEPADNRHAVLGVLTHLHPVAVLLIGSQLPDAILTEADDAHIPVILAAARFPIAETSWPWRIAQIRNHCQRLARVLVVDAASRQAALRTGTRPDRTTIGGVLGVTQPPLRHSEAERAVLAEQLRGRHIWLAAALPPSEELAVTEAHLSVLRRSHRAMLIALPTNPDRAPVLADLMEHAGLICAQRTLDEEPDGHVQVYLADDPYELGLWYRLAQVTYMGGTLSGQDEFTRNPLEPAALGSAIIRGPRTGRFATSWRSLDQAGGTRAVHDSAEMARAVTDLGGADQAATLAANAWGASTAAAGVGALIIHALREVTRSPAQRSTR